MRPMHDTSEDDVPRRTSRDDRGAHERPTSATSIKALVRIARRALRGQEWSSIEFSSGPDGNCVRVHRAMDKVAAARPAPRAPPPAAAAQAPGQLTRKARKTLQYRRHGCLSQFFTEKFTVHAMRRLWTRWMDEVEAHRASAAPPPAAAALGWGDEMMDTEPDPAASSAPPPASAPRDNVTVNRPCAREVSSGPGTDELLVGQADEEMEDESERDKWIREYMENETHKKKLQKRFPRKREGVIAVMLHVQAVNSWKKRNGGW